MSLATLHTEARRRLIAAQGYPARFAARAAIGVAVHALKAERTQAAAMHAWHTDASHRDLSPPPNFVAEGCAPAFALIGIAAHRPLFLVGALAALAALPLLILSKFI